VRIRKLTGYIGAEIEGVEINSGLSDSEQSQIISALNDHHVIAFRCQSISLSDQKEFTKIFGELVTLPYVTPIKDDESVIAVLKEADERNTGVFGGEWHSDFSFLENPPAGSVLNARDIPETGGDTIWANQVIAYETLPADLKALVNARKAVHVGKPYGVKFAPPIETQANASIKMRRGDPLADREVCHPAVITLPATGQQALFLNPIYTTRFDDMTVEQSAPYLEAIYKHCSRPDFSMRWKWQEGDVVVWNNRTTLHYATNDYDGFRRLLYRTTYQGVAPN